MKKYDKDKIDMDNLNDVILTSKKILHVGYIIAVILLVVLVTYLTKAWNLLNIIKTILVVISPVFIGLIIAWLFDPIVKALQKSKIPRLIGCLIVYIVFFGVIGLTIYFLMPTFAHQIKEFISSIPGIMLDLKDFINDFLNNFTSSASINLETTKTQIFESIEVLGTNITNDLPNNLINTLKSFINGGFVLILGIMIGFYMLYDFDKVQDGILDVLPKSWRKNAKELMLRINKSLRNYVQGVLLVMLLVFITQSIGLTLAGLKAPLIFALFCALTDIIPYFGPYIGGIPAVIVGFTMSPIIGVCTLLSIVVVQILENNFYQPIIMGKTMKLHPVTIILGLLIFQHFFGIIGMIVATPVISSIKIIFTFVDEKLNILEKIKRK